MPLPPDFPLSPYEILQPDLRWSPDPDDPAMQKLPPLVEKLRQAVKDWRDSDYQGASKTAISLLRWWFNTEHVQTASDGHRSVFQYYFAQREAVETIIYLYEIINARNKIDLIPFDASGTLTRELFPEDWLRLVVKMATGTGKTKVMSLVMAWCYFHRLYEPKSELSKNFLLIAPNIIVLDRLRKDFDALSIFFNDPVLPDNGYDNRDWKRDFQLTVHIQDELSTINPSGNIFLTNIHRVYTNDVTLPTAGDIDSTDYFLGEKVKGSTLDSKVDLDVIVRDIDELAVFNDEAHHIHDEKLEWFKSIKDIHHRLIHKGKKLALQLDTTATPKHENGEIFLQTITDYPLVEAISQNIVKHPVLPDKESQQKLKEKNTTKFTQRYRDYLHLGVIEWRKAYKEHRKMNQKSVLFVMTDNINNAKETAAFLESSYLELQDAVLLIHTKKDGEISEAASNKKSLEDLRKQANEIDNSGNPYKAIVSVMVLKEGWDVNNVTTIVGLRSFKAKSKILPEQTLGRGLRMMYSSRVREELSVIGTDAFMEFVESIQAEGVILERKGMGEHTPPKAPLIVEIDDTNKKKDIDALNIDIPILKRRMHRDFANLEKLDVASFSFTPIPYIEHHPENKREIIFRDIVSNEINHIQVLDENNSLNYREALRVIASYVVKKVNGVNFSIVYGKVKEFVQNYLFGRKVSFDDINTLLSFAESTAAKVIIDTFVKELNAWTIRDKGSSTIEFSFALKNSDSFISTYKNAYAAKKCAFNYIVGDSGLEIEFAKFLDKAQDVQTFTKNYIQLDFKLDYVNAGGSISNYHPDFIVKDKNDDVYIVETKGLADQNVPLKMERLKQWCEDINAAQNDTAYNFVYVDEKGFTDYPPKTFSDLIASFQEYKGS